MQSTGFPKDVAWRTSDGFATHALMFVQKIVQGAHAKCQCFFPSCDPLAAGMLSWRKPAKKLMALQIPYVYGNDPFKT